MELRERTTVHFAAYRENELFIGARTPEERNAIDLTVELSDWSMMASTSGFTLTHPTDFAVGGRLLSDIVPLIGRLMKRLASR